MAEQSPVVPSQLGQINDGILACDALRSLLQTRVDMQSYVGWQVDSAGNLTTDFKTAIAHQLFFDLLKKGWFVRSNPSTGFLELVELIPLASLDGSGSVEGDTLVFEGGVWITKSSPSIYLAPTSGGATVPAAATGGALTVAHGLGSTPSKFSAFLECNAADLNYAIGDKVDALSVIYDNGVNEILQAVTVFANATVVGVIFRNGAGSGDYQIYNKSTFAAGNLDPAKWNVFLYASL